MKTVTLGGNRLGSGKKQTVSLHGFERSTHDLGYVWRNTQAPGTLVPFMNMLALPGDDFEINLGADVKTHPTLGPLFASFKLQLDVFQCPIRLYHAWLHNNKLKIGNQMSTVKLPQIEFHPNCLRWGNLNKPELNEEPLEFQQINQSSIFAYLGIRGLGDGDFWALKAKKLAVPYLAYWDIYKNYYANKQEEIGAVIHTEDKNRYPITIEMRLNDSAGAIQYTGNGANINKVVTGSQTYWFKITIPMATAPEITETGVKVFFNLVDSERINDLTYTVTTNEETTLDGSLVGEDYVYRVTWTNALTNAYLVGINIMENSKIADLQKQIAVKTFPLENIDIMRENLLYNVKSTDPFIIKKEVPLEPYTLPLEKIVNGGTQGQIYAYCSQEGLALKTYQSDIFNNWLNTEWIDGNEGINQISKVSTAGGSFTMDSLNLAQKVYDMLNRIAVSGGSYEDWQEAVYDHNGFRRCETPMYMGGLSKEIIFQEVVSTAATDTKEGEATNKTDLGTLAGRGTMASKHKGGQVHIKVDEPSFIIGIVSITPRVDYYQGNDWTTRLQTMDDLHKPNLDEIGFQDLITDKMAFWDTYVNTQGNYTLPSAGKQPAWIDYMTNFNKLYGNFADERSEMFMTLARRYTPDAENCTIADLTTYIDPSKFNYAFAQTDLTAMNFWVQIGCDITARRKISAKIMPNL